MAPDSPAAREAPDVDVRRVLQFVGAFLAVVLALVLGLSFYYRAITRGEKLGAALQAFPAPRLQPNPAQDWATFHAAQVQALEGYAWVDRDTALVHVPIDRAMALVASRGAAAYDPVEGTPPYPAAGMPPLDGAPRAVPQAEVAPYGAVR